ncbi:MAG: sialate O-acetylesterase [Bacteroidaceae bacterium]|nr:sialate O-acetylesterase [Bacteroidaceae bacterium]
MKKIALLMALCGVVASIQAKVKPGSLIGDGMVLQQKSEVKLWGWAKPNATVKITSSWKAKATAQADASGKWETRLQTPEASFMPQEVTISDGEKLKLSNVLIGEVWLGSGQSNMEMPLVGYRNCPIENLNQVVSDCSRYQGKLHFAVLDHQAPLQPVDSVKVEWKDCTPETIWKCSATCYFFGITLIDALHCPVGVISSSWGGTSVEGWVPREVAQNYTELNLSDENLKKNVWNTPIVRYNGKIHPIKGYTLKGFLWYQGEANRDNADKYASRLGDMVRTWRQLWGQGDLPFYEVEIAPFIYEGINGQSAALLREAQLQFTHEVPNTGIVCTNDLVLPFEERQIHPAKKREVGQRLCYLALEKTYGKKGLMAESPEFQKMEVKDGKAYLSFSHCEYGFNLFNHIEGFEICGADKNYYPAQASHTHDGLEIVLSAPEVKTPTAVRYCFKNWQLGNLANVGGMPVFPFRTDK